MHDYSIESHHEEIESSYRSDQRLALCFEKQFAVTSDLTLDAAREYLRTLPADEEIDQHKVGNCLGARTIRFLYPQALENNLAYISFTTSRGSFEDATHFWHVPASYDFADLMWNTYDRAAYPDGTVTAGELLKLIAEYEYL